MTVLESISNLETYAIQSGNSIAIEIECFDSAGSAITLSGVTAFGCTLSEYGSPEIALETIIGTIKSETTNTMVISITSEMTTDLSDCLLIYRPFILIGTEYYKFQGKLYIAKSTPIVLPT